MIDKNTYINDPLIVKTRENLKPLMLTKKGKYSKRKIKKNYKQIQFILFDAIPKFLENHPEIREAEIKEYTNQFADYKDIALGDSVKFALEMEATRNEWDDENYY